MRPEGRPNFTVSRKERSTGADSPALTRWKVIAGTVGLALSAAVGLTIWVAWPLPDHVTARVPAPALTLLDRHGIELRTTRTPDGARGGWVPLEEIDPDLLRAFIALEDHRFFDHGGVDIRAVARAFHDNVRARRIVSGASTITMQLARLVAPTPRTWLGKVGQALWAVRLERHLSKQEILEQYLNRVPLGQGTVGVAAAASLYFGASPRDVSVGQAALLAGLARAPSRDNPLVAPTRARQRRDLALGRLEQLGWTGVDERRRAEAEPVLTHSGATAFLAPHFTSRVLLWSDGLASAGVADGSQATDGVGLRGTRAGAPMNGTWRTSLDLALQAALEAEVRHSADLLRRHGARHGAAVVLDNVTGEILAWVGSPDFWADTAGQVDMVVSPRQPGSTLKPFLYGLAFDRGYSPASVLPDVEREYSTPTGPYRPRNYDRRFHGPVRIREALASSYNVPAVEITDRLGVGALLHTLHLAGFASLAERAEHYGLGLALGNGDVTLLELANGYRALANGGVWRDHAWRAAEGARSGLGEPARFGPRDGRRVMSERAAALVLDVLADPAARIPGFGVETPFDFAFPVAVKTGTSRHYTDNWAVGVTGRFTVAVWVGNFSGRPMDAVSGVTGAGPLLHRAVLAAAARYAPGTLPAPEASGNVPVRVCRLSGKGATPSCPETVEFVAPRNLPLEPCDWHRGGRVVLPPEFGPWVERHLGRGDWIAAAERAPPERAALERATQQPSGADELERTVAGDIVDADEPHPTGAPNEPGFRIVSPLDGDSFEPLPGVPGRYSTITFRAVGAAEGERLRWFVDGRWIPGARWQLAPGRHTIRAAAAPSGRSAEVTISVH